jgi:hypothetical protein
MEGLFANQTISRDCFLTVLPDNSDGKVMANDKLEGMWKEMVVA